MLIPFNGTKAKESNSSSGMLLKYYKSRKLKILKTAVHRLGIE